MNNLEMLKWQVEMGADEAISESPTDNFAVKKPNPATTNKTQAPNPEPQALNPEYQTTTPKDASTKARGLADSCNTLEELKSAVLNFDGCSIKKTATNTVFSDGNPKSEVMFIGEAPGAQEDIEGIPFCGASGKLLDNMLEWIGLKRAENYYISNTIFWRPPGNRKPTPEEIMTCRPFVEKHIALIKPKLIILIGGTATTALLDTKTGITKLRGKYFNYSNTYLEREIPVGVIFHPSYLLRSPGQKRHTWQDLLSIKAKLVELNA